MLTLREAFTLGYLPAAMGAYWNGVALLVRIAEQPEEQQLRVRLKKCEAALREQEATISEDLLQVDTLLQKLGPDATTIEPIRVRPNDVLDPDEPALTPALLQLCEWLSDYYLAPVGEVTRGNPVIPSNQRTPLCGSV